VPAGRKRGYHVAEQKPLGRGNNRGMMQDWLNRLGLTLQFIALFLTSPEIVGKERMAAAMGRMSERLAGATAWLLSVAFGALVLWIFLGHATFVSLEHDGVAVHWDRVIIITSLTIGWPLSLAILFRLFRAVVDASRSFLPFGAGLFTLGYVLVMTATFVPDNHWH
jgi:hypothetical protein